MNVSLDNAVFNVTGNRLMVSTGSTETYYRLPTGARKITVWHYAKGRAALAIGGFVKPSITITGPEHVIAALRDAVL